MRNLNKVYTFIVCFTAAVFIVSLSEYFDTHVPGDIVTRVYCRRVVDGDTMVVRSGSKDFRVRLIGIDTPELNRKRGDALYMLALAAKEFLKKKTEDKTIELEFEAPYADRYGRTLAYVYKDGELINATIVRMGYGRVFRRYPCKMTEYLIELENEAVREELGIWKK